jgi:hypothetical protein
MVSGAVSQRDDETPAAGPPLRRLPLVEVRPVLVAFRLGHTSTRMLEQHYAGRLDRADRELGRALDAAARVRHVEGSRDANIDVDRS